MENSQITSSSTKLVTLMDQIMEECSNSDLIKQKRNAETAGQIKEWLIEHPRFDLFIDAAIQGALNERAK